MSSQIRWKLAEYLKNRGLTPEKLIVSLGDTIEPETIYRIVENPKQQPQIDLPALAKIMESLILLTGIPVSISEMLEFIPDLPVEFLEKFPWQDSLSNEYEEPYDWGDEDPLTVGKPVRYVPGVGAVIED